jgi:hypothetical protein
LTRTTPATSTPSQRRTKEVRTAACARTSSRSKTTAYERVYQDPNAPAITFTEPCVRAHVPNDLNGSAGLALGRFAQAERVIDLEKYDLDVTA